MKTITATDFARNVRQYLDSVEFRGEEYAVTRNRHPVARLAGGAARMTALQAMSDLYRTLPDGAAKGWVRDSRASGLRNRSRNPRNPWG